MGAIWLKKVGVQEKHQNWDQEHNQGLAGSGGIQPGGTDTSCSGSYVMDMHF